LFDEDKGLCTCMSEEHDAHYEKDWGDDDVAEESPLPLVIDDLSHLVVKQHKRRRERKAPRGRFVDEPLKPSLSPSKIVE
ncbi:hypothetical protein PFISCL1PPCAC_22753, partial [Pristionchus fissidentatus]